MPSWEPVEVDGIRQLQHPLNGWLYEDLGDEEVQVTTPKGKTGRFTVEGKWLEGELTDANPHLCNWVSGKQLSGASMASDPRTRNRARATAAATGSSRAQNAQLQRDMLEHYIPSVASKIPDIELTSSIFFTVFPNWHPWGSFNQINYRFRPNGDNHEECIMECMFLAPIPEDGDYTPVSEVHALAADDDYTEAAELGMLTKVFNQDVRNLEHVYSGMKATAREHIRFADYNELKLRHWHELYEQLIDDVED